MKPKFPKTTRSVNSDNILFTVLGYTTFQDIINTISCTSKSCENMCANVASKLCTNVILLCTQMYDMRKQKF